MKGYFYMLLLLFMSLFQSCNYFGNEFPSEFYEKVGFQIRNTRLLRGLTQQQLADSVGVTQNALSLIEDGMATPMHNKLIDIQDFLDTTFYIDAEMTTIEEYMKKNRK